MSQIPQKNNGWRPSRLQTGLAFLMLAACMLLPPFEHVVKTSASDAVYRIYAGFYLSIIATFASAVFLRLLQSLRQGTLLDDIDSNKWTRPFGIATILFLFLFAIVVWCVNWIGKTGIGYGLAFAAGSFLTEMGLGKIVKSGY